MHDFLRGRLPWGKFVRMVDALRIDSHYRNKLLKDPDLAEFLLRQELANGPAVDDGDVDLPYTDETPTYQAIRSVVDLLQQLVFLTAGNPASQPPAPQPRPMSALAQLKEERVQHEVDAAMAALTGGSW